jgi:predicted Fe-Mo cluster-binding NifX family protein
MKAITVKDDNIKSQLEDCFGKAKYFCLVENDPNKIEFVLNPGNSSAKGSGKKAVLCLLERGVKTIISRNYGLTAKKMLDKHNIQTVIVPPKYERLFQLLKIIKTEN